MSQKQPNDQQKTLRLQTAPEPETLDLLYRTFGDVLIPLEQLRIQYFRNLNETTFLEQLNSGRIALPVVSLDPSRKALKYVHIRHLASLIDMRAYRADEAMVQPERDGTDHAL